MSYSTCLGSSWEDAGLGIAVDNLGSAYVIGYAGGANFPTQDPYQSYAWRQDVFVTKLSPSGDSLIYSTYLGGGGDDIGYSVAVDGSGSAYITGETDSYDFPTQNPYQARQPGIDAFVSKLSPSGSSLVYSTYLGGNGSDKGRGIAVDGLGSAYVTGETGSNNFPTLNPYQSNPAGFDDVFVTKLSPSGNSLAYSTYLGGGYYDKGYGIAVDSSGSAYITGETGSDNFPKLNPYQNNLAGFDDVFVTKLSPSGESLVYSTYLGGDSYDGGHAIAVDSSGSAYITGDTGSYNFPLQNPYQTDPSGAYKTAFVTKFSPSGNGLLYSTYLGGHAPNLGAYLGYGIAVDSLGNAYVTGTFQPSRYDPFWGDYEAFVTKISPPGNTLAYSTYLGGSWPDEGYAIAVDSLGNAYVTGRTDSPNFPTQDPYQTDQPWRDVFVTKLGPLPPTDFFTLSPCRLIDTRNAEGPYGGPVLDPSRDDRRFRVAGRCGIPATARAISVNIAVTAPSAAGNLRLYAAGPGLPLGSSINYGAGQTRSSFWFQRRSRS